MRALMGLGPSLFGFGCHVFEDVEVTCTSDMPCAKDPGGDADTDADSDSDSDTDLPGDPVLGWSVSLVGGTAGRVRVYDPVTREIVAEWSGFGTIGGAAYYDPNTGDGLLIGTDGIVRLFADGSSEAAAESGLTGDSWDVSRLGKHGILSFEGGVYQFDASLARDPVAVVPPGTFASIDHIGGSGTLAFFADTAGGAPDLWSLRAGGDYEKVVEDYDTSTSRAVNVFVGPGGDPFGCSTAGATYAIYALVDGDRSPYAYYDGDLSDVTKCDWDQGSAEFLLYSPTAGIFRMDKYGKAQQVYSPPNGYTLFRAYFYEVP